MYDIKARRNELGLTLEEVGSAVGVGKSTVRKWENGMIDNMKRDKISLLSKALKINPLLLIKDDLDKPIENDLENIYYQLNEERQQRVYNFADLQLQQQQFADQNIEEPEDDILVAAHIDADATEEELEEIKAFIEKVKKEHRDGK